MEFFLDELVKVEVAERARAVQRLALARSARVARPPLRVRVGLRLVALGEHLSRDRVAAAAAIPSRAADR